MKRHTFTALASVALLSLGALLSGCQSEMSGGKMTDSADPKMSSGDMGMEKKPNEMLTDGKMSGSKMSDEKMADEKMEKK